MAITVDSRKTYDDRDGSSMRSGTAGHHHQIPAPQSSTTSAHPATTAMRRRRGRLGGASMSWDVAVAISAAVRLRERVRKYSTIQNGMTSPAATGGTTHQKSNPAYKGIRSVSPSIHQFRSTATMIFEPFAVRSNVPTS